MREIIIQKNDAGQRLDKYLNKLLPNAGTSFLYKMLRKKNITLNEKKALGKEALCEGDVVRIFFSDETFLKFTLSQDEVLREYEALRNLPMKGLAVVYEDEDILALNKPADMLSQKAGDLDCSANERMLGHLIREGALTLEEYRTFHPSVCNRLDRNTTGLLLAGKSLRGLQELSAAIKDRSIRKYYLAAVTGELRESRRLTGCLIKDEQTNRVTVLSDDEAKGQKAHPNAQRIETVYKPLKFNGSTTLLEVELITGKSHQIRAHLASIGHPIIGDYKYGDEPLNRRFRKEFGVKYQMLHASRVEFADGRVITAPEPAVFARVF